MGHKLSLFPHYLLLTGLEASTINSGSFILYSSKRSIVIVQTVLNLEYVIVQTLLNPLPTIRNSLKKQKSLYKVLTPSITTPI